MVVGMQPSVFRNTPTHELVGHPDGSGNAAFSISRRNFVVATVRAVDSQDAERHAIGRMHGV
jgi:hypothetical protein